MRHWDEHGFGTWTMRERATGEVVGRAGLQVTDVGEGPAVEVGWFVARDRWGRGYAPELAGAALEHAFAGLRLQEVVAVTLHANTASQRVMAKLGLEPAGEVEHAGLPHRLFRRRAADGDRDGAGPEASAAPMAPPGPSG
jgi:RimJ/RimL family protein N-acetyltransferase